MIPGVFTVYRDAGAIAHGHPEVRESAYHVGLSLIEQAACYGSRYVGMSLYTMGREEAEDPERYQAGSTRASRSGSAGERGQASGLKQLLTRCRRPAGRAAPRSRRRASRWTCSRSITGRTRAPRFRSALLRHGPRDQPRGNRDEANRDFRAWFSAFPAQTVEVHLKITDAQFLETWHLATRTESSTCASAPRGPGHTHRAEVFSLPRNPRKASPRSRRAPGDRGPRSTRSAACATGSRRSATGEDPADFGWSRRPPARHSLADAT
jgi:hypothetical protein